jgi:hypothetical protein
MTETKKEAFLVPYISAGEFVKFINSLRNNKPDPLTLDALRKIGVSNSNSYTLYGSLKGLAIYDDDGKLLQRGDLIDLASKDESTNREAYKRILDRTYRELMKAIPVHGATVERVRDYFERKGAKPTIALKGARLFIWLANQAGLDTAEQAYSPYNIERDTTPVKKQREAITTHSKNGSSKSASIQESIPYVPKTAEEEEDRLLNTLQEQLSKVEGAPPLDLVQVILKLIDRKRERSKSHHTTSPQPSAKETGDV